MTSRVMRDVPSGRCSVGSYAMTKHGTRPSPWGSYSAYHAPSSASLMRMRCSAVATLTHDGLGALRGFFTTSTTKHAASMSSLR